MAAGGKNAEYFKLKAPVFIHSFQKPSYIVLGS